MFILPKRGSAWSVSEAAWLTGWTYRKEFYAERDDGAVTDYQVKILVGESSGATGENVDCAEHCLSTFADLRFTSSDGTTLLDYWIESISGTTPNQLATVWVKLDSIGTDPTKFYMYYGKADAASESSGVDTFIFFEDFEALNYGTLNGQNGWSGSTVFQLGYCAAFGGTKAIVAENGGTAAIAQSVSIDSYNVFLQWQMQTNDFSNQYIIGAYAYEGANLISGIYFSDSNIIHLYASGWESCVSPVTNNTWYKCMIAFDSASSHKIFINDVEKSPAHSTNNHNVLSDIDSIVLERYSYTTSRGYIDQVIVGKYLYPTPTVGSWGSEES